MCPVQDEVQLVGLRHTVSVDASAIAMLPVPEDVDEDAARLSPGAKLKGRPHECNLLHVPT